MLDGVEMSIPMRDGIDRSLAARLRTAAWALLGLCALASVMVLAGWILDVQFLRKPIEDQAAVQSSIALTYLLCGGDFRYFSLLFLLSLCCATREHEPVGTTRRPAGRSLESVSSV